MITPSAVLYEFGGIFDDNVRIKLWGYNIETVMAEKVETILSRGIFNTRPRDFYDVYILGTTREYSKTVFREALEATAIHRGSFERIFHTGTILEQILESNDLRQMWEKYQKKFAYAKDVLFEDIVDVLHELLSGMSWEREKYERL